MNLCGLSTPLWNFHWVILSGVVSKFFFSLFTNSGRKFKCPLFNSLSCSNSVGQFQIEQLQTPKLKCLNSNIWLSTIINLAEWNWSALCQSCDPRKGSSDEQLETLNTWIFKFKEGNSYIQINGLQSKLFMLWSLWNSHFNIKEIAQRLMLMCFFAFLIPLSCLYTRY